MKRRRFILNAATGLMVPFVAAPIARAATIIIGGPMRAVPTAGGGGGASYLINQNFENTGATGYDNSESWTTSATGTIDSKYTGTVLRGSQSLRCVASAQTISVISPTFTGQSDGWIYFRWQNVGTLPALTTIIARLMADTTTDALQLRVTSTGTIGVRARGGSELFTTGTVSPDTTTHFWCRCTPSTGSSNGFASVGFSTDGTKPTSGNNYKQVTNGTAIANFVHVRLGQNTSGTYEFLYDQVLVDDATIGDNPA